MTEQDGRDYFLTLAPGARMGQAIYVGNLEDGSEAWHKQRRTGIGGSDIGSVAGVPGAFKSRKRVWLERAGFLPPEEITPAKQVLFDMGHAIEDATTEMAVKVLEGHYGVGWRAFNTGSWHAAGAPWHLANPDRFLLTPDNELTILECKYSSRGYGWESYGCPAHYVAQLRWYLGAFGISYGFLAAWVQDEVLVFRVPLEATEPVACLNDGSENHYGPPITDLVIAADKFMSSLPTEDNPDGFPPPNDGDEAVRSFYVNRHPEIENEDLEIGYELASEFVAARSALTEAEERFNKARADIAEVLGKKKRAVYTEPGKKNPRVIARRQAGKGGSVSLYAGPGTNPVEPPEDKEGAVAIAGTVSHEEENTPTKEEQ